MKHEFEFVVTKKQTPQEVEEKKEQEVLNLVYKTESNRKNKVAQKIRKELDVKGIIKEEDMQDFYLRQLK